MADNTLLNAGSGGDTIASDDILGVKFQRVKITLGADAVNDGDVASGNPLPAQGVKSNNAAAPGATNIGALPAVATAAAPTYTEGFLAALSVDLAGKLRVIIPDTVQVDVTDEALRDLGKVDVASLDQYTPVAGRLPVDGSGVTQPVSGTVTANAGTGTRDVRGDLAHDALETSNPVALGALAVAHGSSPTAVAAADRVRAIANRHGIPFSIGGHPNTFRAVRKDTAAQTDAILQAVAPGQIAVITAISVYCSNANTVNVQALIEFDAVTDVVIVEHPNIAAGSGFVEGGSGGILAIGADGQDVLWTCTVPTGGSVTVHVSGYLIES